MLHDLISHILLAAVRPRAEEAELVQLLTQAAHVLYHTQDGNADLHRAPASVVCNSEHVGIMPEQGVP